MSRLSNLADAVHAELDDATVEKVIGRRKDGRHGQRRRVHWYSDGGDIDTGKRAGGAEISGGTKKEPTVWARYERLNCLIMAESVDSLDTLLDNMIVAIDHTVPNGSAIFEGYSWDYDEVAQRVPATELVFSVQWPVADEIKDLVVITDEGHICDFEETE